MVQKRETKAINKLCVREILSLSFVCGAYFFEFRGRNLVCFVIAYNFNGKYAPEAGKTRMRTAFFTRVLRSNRCLHGAYVNSLTLQTLLFSYCCYMLEKTGSWKRRNLRCSHHDFFLLLRELHRSK